MKTYVVRVGDKSALTNAEDEVTAVKLARARGLVGSRYEVIDHDCNVWMVDVSEVGNG
jgi:hypothetical protein